jgi:hypothetical protein
MTKPSKSDFKDLREWYKAELALYSFEVVRDTIKLILEKGLDHRSLEYHSLASGLICTYARPFTKCDPVGKLSEENIPSEFGEMHAQIMAMRHKLFAHAEASLKAGPDEYPNEAVIVNHGKKTYLDVSRSTPIPSFLAKMLPLTEALIEKMRDYRKKYWAKFAEEVKNLGPGEFRLNLVDRTAPFFTKLSRAERRVREEKKRIFDPNSEL